MRLRNTYALFLSLGLLASTSAVLTGCNSSTSNPAASTDPATTDTAATDGMADHNMASGADSEMMHSMTMDLGPEDAEFDLRFIDGMILHHQGAINMAEAALQNSQRDEIKQLAQTIITAQQGEIEQMQQWRQAWYPEASAEPLMYHAEMGHSMPMSSEMQTMMRMDGDLGKADDEFDLRFIDGMIPHHEGALTMAQQALEKSDRPELKQLSEEILASQQAEIDQMNQWKQAWYGS
jgi:uncharacterized protein (DUF305 family)